MLCSENPILQCFLYSFILIISYWILPQILPILFYEIFTDENIFSLSLESFCLCRSYHLHVLLFIDPLGEILLWLHFLLFAAACFQDASLKLCIVLVWLENLKLLHGRDIARVELTFYGSFMTQRTLPNHPHLTRVVRGALAHFIFHIAWVHVMPVICLYKVLVEVTPATDEGIPRAIDMPMVVQRFLQVACWAVVWHMVQYNFVWHCLLINSW